MMRTWWQKLFPALRPARQARRGSPRPRCLARDRAADVWRLALERLEDRLAPAVVNYVTATQALAFTADAGRNDAVFVSAPAANQVRVVVGSGDAIALAGDAVANPNFVLS